MRASSIERGRRGFGLSRDALSDYDFEIMTGRFKQKGKGIIRSPIGA